MYQYKGKLYKFIYDTVRKCPNTREWIGVVIYESVENGHLYVRDGVDFYSNFRKLDQFEMPKLDYKKLNRNLLNLKIRENE